MKTLVSFIRTTITGGILFLLPLILLIILLNKVFTILIKISYPISKRLPDFILGLDGSIIVAVILLIFICFISGLLFRSPYVKKIVGSLEENLLNNIPGYTLVKAITADTLGEKTDHMMSPVLIRDGDSWNFALLVEEGEKLSTVFIPDAPRLDAGELKIIPTESFKKLDVSTNIFARSIKNYGKGSLKWIN